MKFRRKTIIINMDSLEMNSEPKDRHSKLLCLDVKVWIVILLVIMISGFVALTIGIESLNCNSHDCSPQSFTQTLQQTGNWRNRLMYPGNGKGATASRIQGKNITIPCIVFFFYNYTASNKNLDSSLAETISVHNDSMPLTNLILLICPFHVVY